MAVVRIPGTLICASLSMLPAPRVVRASVYTSFGTGPLSSFAAQNCRGVTFYPRVRKWQPVMVTQKASPAETKEKEDEEVIRDEANELPEEQSGSALPVLVEEFRAALASNDEAIVTLFEQKLKVIEDERDSLGKLVNSLTEEIQIGKERFLRLNADFDNFRKRSEAEKTQISSNVKGDVIESLLPMVDNFERAKTSIKTETEGEQKIDRSYQSIYKQFVEIMKGLGVVAVETTGKMFDPNLHEAIMREESTEYEEGIVLQEFRRGFVIGSKLLRPAMVKVSAGPGPKQEAAEPAKGDSAEEIIEVEAE